MATLLIPTALRGFTDRKAEVLASGQTVAEVLSALTREYPDILPHIFDENGNLRSFINIFIGETNIKNSGGLTKEVKDEDVLMLVPAIAGGRMSEGFGFRR